METTIAGAHSLGSTGLRRGYCAQCWSHHSRVYHWPGFDDDWPKEYYFEVSWVTSLGWSNCE